MHATPMLPLEENLPLATAATGPYYSSFMDYCHLWLHPANAGKIIQYYRGYRGERFWGSQSRLLATWRHSLLLFEVDDGPLVNAAVRVYHSPDKWFPERAKFTGSTDAEGRFEFPHETAPSWDDPVTDEVEGQVAVWNPFGRGPDKGNLFHDVPFTPNVIETQGILLVEVESGGATELHWVTDLDFQCDFFAGHRLESKIVVRTSLRSSERPPRRERRRGPRGARETNLAPEAVVDATELRVPCGEEGTIDASRSTDPEGQRLRFFWSGPHVEADAENPAVGRVKAPRHEGDFEVEVTVTDGMRRAAATITVHAVAKE